MPFTKVMIHFIWATKKREPIITPKLRPLLLSHIRENAKAKGIHINRVNCVDDHIHSLISLGTEQTISKIAMLIKGESSFWVNKQKIIKGKFEWQDDYIALSVSESAIPNVQRYIENQEEHHRKKTFKEEYEAFLKESGFSSEDFG